MKKKVLNYTPHDINLFLQDGSTMTIKSSGSARVSSTETVVSTDLGIPETMTVYGDVVDLPAPADDTIIIVSRLVLSRCPDRPDLRVPGLQVRDSDGKVIGCKSLARN
jgi:hypothetical protein